MRIHLADASKERGQYQTLIDERYTATLFSYAYPLACNQYAPPMWDELVKLHLTETTAKLSADREMEQKVKPESQNHLATFADKTEVNNTEYSVIDLRPRVIVDSGAFTAWTSGKPIDPRDYAKWALDFKDRWEYKMQALYFMNLDVIGDQDASWVNQSILEGLGLKPIPIITFGAEKRHLIKALDNYNYIALGGLVPYTRDKAKLQKWLDFCFAIIMQKYKATGVMPKIHLLGVTTDWVLKRYPCFSSDSSTWVSCLRFGGGAAAGIKQLPRYKKSDAAMASTIHTLRAEIRKYKKMEQEATNLWTKRGIFFND